MWTSSSCGASTAPRWESGRDQAYVVCGMYSMSYLVSTDNKVYFELCTSIKRHVVDPASVRSGDSQAFPVMPESCSWRRATAALGSERCSAEVWPEMQHAWQFHLADALLCHLSFSV